MRVSPPGCTPKRCSASKASARALRGAIAGDAGTDRAALPLQRSPACRLYRTDLEAGPRHDAASDELPRGVASQHARNALDRSARARSRPAYLNVQKIRMETRLDFDIDVPDRLRSTVIPPMMLATLVENIRDSRAGALPAGGRIHISAEEQANKLLVRVADNGRGPATHGARVSGFQHSRAPALGVRRRRPPAPRRRRRARRDRNARDPAFDGLSPP